MSNEFSQLVRAFKKKTTGRNKLKSIHPDSGILKESAELNFYDIADENDFYNLQSNTLPDMSGDNSYNLLVPEAGKECFVLELDSS